MSVSMRVRMDEWMGDDPRYQNMLFTELTGLCFSTPLPPNSKKRNLKDKHTQPARQATSQGK